MPTFAVIKDGIVVNTILADTVEIAEMVTGTECVLSETAAIGDLWDGTQFTQQSLIVNE